MIEATTEKVRAVGHPVTVTIETGHRDPETVEADRAPGSRKAEGRLVEGAVTTSWKAALGGLAIAYPDRITTKIN